MGFLLGLLCGFALGVVGIYLVFKIVPKGILPW